MSKSLLVHILDDDDAVRDSLFTLLRSAGFSVRTHNCAKSFFEEYRADETGCVLVDMRMPDATGSEVQERISRMADGPPIIIITGHADIRMAVTAMKKGAIEFLEKPVDPQILAGSCRQGRQAPRICRSANAKRSRKRKRKIGILTPREKDVLKHLLIGRPNKIIARELGLSPRTVEIHRARVMEKTGAGSLPRLVQDGACRRARS